MKILSAILAFILLFFPFIDCIAENETNLRAHKDIIEISILRRQKPTTVKKSIIFEVDISNKNTVDYIMNLLENMYVNESGSWIFDTDETYMTLKDSDDNFIKILIDSEGDFRIFEPLLGKIYCFNPEELDYFLSVVEAIQAGDFVVVGKIDKEVSEWAENYINIANERKCIPNIQQMGYQMPVTRLDVCEIIEQFLCKSNLKHWEFWYYQNFYYEIMVHYENISREKWESITDKIMTDDEWLSYPEMRRLKQENLFDDCNRKSVVLLRMLGIIDGKTNNEFSPFDVITREEMAKILSNLWNYLNPDLVIEIQDSNYNDYDEISDWAKTYVDKMSSVGILRGDNNGNFAPQRHMTKEEVLVSLLRLFEFA